MGWKNVKEHYQIGHIVQVVEGKGICIGSPYVQDLIVIGLNGAIKRNSIIVSKGDDLDKIASQMEDDPQTLRDLINSPDQFSESITVYTYDGGEILEKQCEELGWPNVTHDGCLMYGNTFSADSNKVIAWAKQNAEAGIVLFRRRLDEIDRDRLEISGLLSKCGTDLGKLNALAERGGFEPPCPVANHRL